VGFFAIAWENSESLKRPLDAFLAKGERNEVATRERSVSAFYRGPSPWSCEKIVSVGAGRCAGPSRYSRKSWNERGLGATWNATAGVPYSHPAISSQLPSDSLSPMGARENRNLTDS
jgi:hypothetical protein